MCVCELVFLSFFLSFSVIIVNGLFLLVYLSIPVIRVTAHQLRRLYLCHQGHWSLTPSSRSQVSPSRILRLPAMSSKSHPCCHRIYLAVHIAALPSTWHPSHSCPSMSSSLDGP